MCKVQQVGFVFIINPFESWTFGVSMIKKSQCCLVYCVVFLKMAEVHRISIKKAVKHLLVWYKLGPISPSHTEAAIHISHSSAQSSDSWVFQRQMKLESAAVTHLPDPSVLFTIQWKKKLRWHCKDLVKVFLDLRYLKASRARAASVLVWVHQTDSSSSGNWHGSQLCVCVCTCVHIASALL